MIDFLGKIKIQKVIFSYFISLCFNQTVTKSVKIGIKCSHCSIADGISFEVSLSLNCTDQYKREGGA